MKPRTLLALIVAAATAAGTPAAAQSRVQSRVVTTPDQFDRDRAMLGVTTASGGRRDTLGLLVTAVTDDGPAAKAGLMEGHRIQSINGVNLRLSREDAEDEYLRGINQSRLTREMRKVKPGDEVTLDVWDGSRSRTLRVKTVSAADLAPTRVLRTTRDDDRAVIGVSLTATGSRRDTLGVFVMSVVEGGPAEKAGIVEGDRIASVNGVDVRVAREDAGDWTMASARIDRLTREVRKLRPGETAELVVVSGGRSRTVRVTVARAADLPDGGRFGFDFETRDGVMRFFGTQPGGLFAGPRGATIMPRVKVDADEIRHRIEERLRDVRVRPHVRARIDGELHESLDDFFSFEFPRVLDDVRTQIEREVPEALESIRIAPRVRIISDPAPARVTTRME